MEWLLLAAFGIMWVAFLVPWGRRRSGSATVSDHERRMELLANAEVHGTAGRWIVTPRKGMRFLGPRERHRARVRERRRRVFVFLLEGLGLSLLIGAVPPLRAIWTVSIAFAVSLVLYVWLLLTLKARASQPGEREAAERVAAAQAPARSALAAKPARTRHVAEGLRSLARPTFNGLGSLGEGDTVHVVVKTASAGA